MKNITIAGRLTKDAETRDAGGSRVTGFSVAVDNWDGKTKGTLFFDASMWGDRGEKLAQYLIKGASVTVSGDLGTREHNGKTYLTIRVADVTLQGGKPTERTDDGFRGPVPGGVARGGTRSAAYDLNDDVPF
jgi:single-strand DNA-binding protein